MTNEYLLEKTIKDVTEKYGDNYYSENRLEIILEKYYKICDADFCLDEKVTIWETVSNNIKYN